MKLSDMSSAKGLKFRLGCLDPSARFSAGALIRIGKTQRECEFLVNQYGAGAGTAQPALCRADRSSARYILELFEAEQGDSFRCMFAVEWAGDDSLEVQAYTFRSVTEYKTPISIQVPRKLLEKVTLEKLYRSYVWEQLGEPALFCINFKNRKKQAADVRFLSGKRYLSAHNTVRGIIAQSESYLRDRCQLPVDVYIAPKIEFISESDAAPVNSELAARLEEVSNPASYFARWEAYNRLSQKLLEQESAEFGELHYLSCTPKTDLSGTTFHFVLEEEADLSFLGRELGAGERTDGEEDGSGTAARPRQTAVGCVTKISGKTLTTFLEATEGFDTIPSPGSLSLHTAGSKSIMARRDAARERMIKRQSPIRSIVALIEAGASEYELPGDWGDHRAVTRELERNFKKAAALNPEQIEALNIAVNTPDIALIQGPPGTGKTTVIKAICERFREIYEAEEKQRQQLDPEHPLRSPKILISSFQNDAVDNAISTPLPGDIPAYRKTARRAKNSTMEQYQKALDKWYADVRDSVGALIEDKAAAEFSRQRKLLSDEYLSYKNAGEAPALAAELLRHYLSFPEIRYPRKLLEDAQSVIRAAQGGGADEEIPDPVAAKLEAQRTDPESFADDGRINARRLAAHLRIRDDLELDDTVVEAINAVCGDGYTEEEFSAYVSAVRQLRKRFCRRKSAVDIRDKRAVNECLVAMHECFVNQYMNTLSDMGSKKSLILSEFLSRLEQEYELIVRKYAVTTAATCQTCLDMRDNGQKVFDLVVIDEAARANPLDLFIPMSMGKKLVLVGDHKQLPHMLEPDVLKVIKEDPTFKDLPEMEKSLFERLFEMFSKGPRPKAVLLTEQFRMHPEICSFVSEVFYDSQLRTDKSVTPELRASPAAINHGKALTFVNVPITRGGETRGASKSRPAEVEAISRDIRTILDNDTKAGIGVITFYSAQAAKIRKSLEMKLDNEEMSRVEVGTVDAFQGKEFDYVMLSCVRSNRAQDGGRHQVGFLEKPNRLCVAFSRSIRQLIAYGDVETLLQIPCFSKLYEICAIEGRGCYREY